MRDLHRFLSPDPRDDDAPGLTVEFAILDYGAEPIRHGDQADPGYAAEIDIRAARDPSGRDVFRRLSADHVALVEEDVIDHFDFAKARRDARQGDPDTARRTAR